MLEHVAIGAERRIIVDAAGHVRPVARQHLAVRRFLEIEEAQRVGRRRDDIECLLRALSDGGLPQEGADTAKCCNVRARARN